MADSGRRDSGGARIRLSGNGTRQGSERRADHIVRVRTVWVMGLLGVVTFAVLFWKLFDLQIRQHADMQARATWQQTRSAVVSASRGTIYDRNGVPIAESATAETVNISPKEIAQFVEAQKEAIADASARAEDRKELYTPPRLLDQSYIARGLSRILGVDQAWVEKRMERTSYQYDTIYKKADQDLADEVRRFLNGEIDEEGRLLTETREDGKTVLAADHASSPRKIQGVWLQPDAKRYYPYGTLAANVIGFVNGEDVGGVGLEAKYESDLEGVSGMTVTAKNGAGTDILYQYEQYLDPQDGRDLVLTLDVTVQSLLERGIQDMIARYEGDNGKGATGIVMDVRSGAILAMASYPTYDPNQYGVVLDTTLLEQTEAAQAALRRADYESEEAYEAAVQGLLTSAVQSQWRNKCIDSTYEPGSTFKPITLATALEEGAVTMESTFTCTGSVMVPGWYKPIYCSNHSGHGVQDLKTATGNSCNPAFISMGRAVGTETYYKYLRAFGLMDKTNVDMIGEAKGLFASEESFNSNEVSLASYSFGQTFNVTPLELIRAQAACVNGGWLYEPYIVEQVLGEDGEVLRQHDASPIRQVISAETSAAVRECLEHVVAVGTGKNGQVAGYRIGGKTGTADKTGTASRNADGKPDLVVSFMCFAPADDPQYIMLITCDTPSRTTGTYPSGGQMVAPIASQIMADLLPYLGVERELTEEERASADAAVPDMVGKSAEEARLRLETAGFSVRTVGEEETVTDQVPAGGAVVPNDAQIILYLGEARPSGTVRAPDVQGQTIAEARRALTGAGLILRTAGAARSDTASAVSQDPAAGTDVDPGTVVTVQFADGSVLD